MKLSVIIPVFRGEDTIIPLFGKINETLDGKYEYEVIFVCDDAKDDSWNKIKYLYSLNSTTVKGYKLDSNYGQHRAILFGLSQASGDFMITMDEDMQHDPQYILPMLSYLVANQLEVVYAKFLVPKNNCFRTAGSELFRMMAGFLIPDLKKAYSPYRIIRSDIARGINYGKGLVFIDGLLGKATKKTGEFPVEHLENKRPSSYSYFKLARLASLVILNYSTLAKLLLALVILFLIYFSLGSLLNLPGKLFFLTGLPSLFLFLFFSILILFTRIQSISRRNILVSEQTGILIS